MSQKIEIGVDAKLNTQGVDQGVDNLNQKLGEAARTKIDPVSDQALKKVDALNRGVNNVNKGAGAAGKAKVDPVSDAAIKKAEALFQSYLKLDRIMAQRIKYTGQQGMDPDKIDWSKIYTDEHVRARKLDQLKSFLQKGGVEFTPPGGGGGGGEDPWRNTAKGMAVGTAQAGMRAAGPVGNVAANALGTGMTSGFGAGIAGLFGGLAALGVGKLVGAVAENIEKAENNNIAYDRLKRTLGDVNVSFNGLKSALKSAGDALSITYDEADRLGSTFAKQGNLKAGEYTSLTGELGVGVGVSRALGLDPEQGVGFMAQMRGVGITRDTQDSRRMALLIGETIAKSDAFAKADEVMEALANFAVAQTRQSLSAANVAGYAGVYSSMVGSGMAGMDPAGAASILGRMNAALSAGGARGEASQFFTSMVGNRMGLDPLQMQVLREGGMFASKDQMFGVGSAYTRYMGMTGPTGNQSYYEATRNLIDQKYSGDDERSRLMRAQAFANHTGLNMNQAMAMLSLQPNQMGEMQKYAGDLSKLSASGIGNMGKALFGSGSDRQALAESLLGRDDVSQADKDRLRSAMASGDENAQKEVLAKLAAQYEQERTMGSDIRDSRAALDNIKTNIADKIVPYLADLKRYIAHFGANGKMTERQVQEEIAKKESEGRKEQLKSDMESRNSALLKEKEANRNKMQGLNTLMSSGRISKEEYAQEWGALKRRNDEIDGLIEANKINYEADVKSEDSRHSERVASIRRSSSDDQTGRIAPKGGPIGDPGSINQSMKFFMDKGWTREQAAGITANLMKESNMRPDAVGDGGKAYGIAQWHPDRQRDFERWAGKSIKDATVAEQMAFVHYEMTEGKEKAAGDRLRAAKTAREAGGIVSKYYERPKLREEEAAERGANAERISRSAPADTKVGGAPVNPGRGSAEAYKELRVDNPDSPYRTPLPETKTGEAPGRTSSGRGAMDPINIKAEPMTITIQHQDTWGREVRAPQQMQTRVAAANPNTYSERS